VKKRFKQKTNVKTGKTFFAADKSILSKNAKRAYIALLVVTGAVSVGAYLKNRAEIEKATKTAFDEAAWQSAVEESGAFEEAYPVFEEIPPSEQNDITEAAVIELDKTETEPQPIDETNEEPEIPEAEVTEEALLVSASSETEAPGFIRPSKGRVIKEFSGDELVYQSSTEDWRTHNGTDFAASEGDQVLAVSDGTVKAVFKDDLWGITVEIQHSDSVISRYSGLQSLDFIQEGKTVKQGDIIGGAGIPSALEEEDGAHIHFEIIKNGEYENPEYYFSNKI